MSTHSIPILVVALLIPAGLGIAQEKPDPAKMLNFSKCMRAHGVADFPDPSPGGGLRVSAGPGSDLSPDNPIFQKAQQACQSVMQGAGFGTVKAP